MAIHLIKLSVGSQGIDDLSRWQQSVIRRNKGTALEGFTHHVTRMVPKRADELADGGSMYWVIAGQIQCRQKVVEVQELTTDEGRKCCLVLDPELIPVRPVARGPFQGWRYLKPEDAPSDLQGAAGMEDLPIRAELAELGLL